MVNTNQGSCGEPVSAGQAVATDELIGIVRQYQEG
jgi:hypothetical protein